MISRFRIWQIRQHYRVISKLEKSLRNGDAVLDAVALRFMNADSSVRVANKVMIDKGWPRGQRRAWFRRQLSSFTRET